MQAIRYRMKTPENHELRVHLPPQFVPHQEVEVIVLATPPVLSRSAKLAALREAAHDPLFLQDLKAVRADFAAVDAEGWEGQ